MNERSVMRLAPTAHPRHLARQRQFGRALVPSAMVLRLVGLSGAIVTVGLRIAQILRAPVTKDEFEHLHAAYLVSHGRTPYRDFFQHHPPLYYLTVGRLPLFRSAGWSTLIGARSLAVAASLGVIAIVFVWGREVMGTPGAFLAGAIAAADAFYARNGSRALLDSFAVLGAVAGAWLLTRALREPTRRWAAAGSGACFMAAVLTTQKLIYLGLAVVVVLLSGVRENRGQGVRTAVRFLGGGLVVAILTAASLGPSGVRAMIDDTVLLNLRWRARHRSLNDLRVLARTGLFVYGLAALNVVRTVISVAHRRGRAEPKDIPSLFLCAYGLAFVALPVVWEEFFVSPMPFAAMAAALEVNRIFVNRWPNPILAFMLCVGAVALPLAWQVRSLRHDATGDRDRLELVQAATRPDQPVFDTYSGYGAFRPHLYRYWLLHDEMQLMIDQAELERDLLRAIRAERPPVALEDQFSALLPAGVRAEIGLQYRPTAVDGVWCRMDAPPACGPLGAARPFGGTGHDEG